MRIGEGESETGVAGAVAAVRRVRSPINYYMCVHVCACVCVCVLCADDAVKQRSPLKCLERVTGIDEVRATFHGCARALGGGRRRR